MATDTITKGDTMTATPHKGMRFLHATWKDSRRTLEEMRILPARDKALEHEVTAVRHNTVYYRPVYRHGDREELGACVKCDLANFQTYCMEVL